MKRHLFVAAVICSATWAPTSSPQIPHHLKKCFPTLAQDIHQRLEESEIQEQESSREPAPRQIRVAKLIFRGQTALPREELKEIAKSLKEGRYADSPEWLEELRERIQDVWQHRGYFKAVVEELLVRQLAGTPLEKRFALNMSVEAGQVYHLEGIAFVHSTEFSFGELRSFFPIEDGDIFDTHKIQQGLQKMRKAYAMKGFVNLTAVPTFEIDELHATATLTLELDEGQQLHFGQIKVLGIDPVLAEKLLHESGLEQGRVFDFSLMSKFFERNRDILPPDASPFDDTDARIDETGTVDVTIDVRGCLLLPQY